jgi:hypothetical protein
MTNGTVHRPSPGRSPSEKEGVHADSPFLAETGGRGVTSVALTYLMQVPTALLRRNTVAPCG